MRRRLESRRAAVLLGFIVTVAAVATVSGEARAAGPARPSDAPGDVVDGAPEAAEPQGGERSERRAIATERFRESSTVQAVGGGAGRGEWALELSAGFPWQRLRGQVGIGKGFTFVADFETALGRRFWPAAGVGYRMADLDHFRVTGEVMLGWLVATTPELRKRGFAPMLRMRVASPWGRVAPYLVLGMQPAVLMDRTTTIRADGEDVSWSARPNLSLWGSLGLAVAITERVGLDFGIDAPWVDVPQLTIPGFHVGLFLGGW